MPVPFPGSYDTLRTVACKGVPVNYAGSCEGCGSRGSLRYMGGWVTRGAVIAYGGSTIIAYHRLQIPLARCEWCGYRVRVLPWELLPRKTYGIEVIEMVVKKVVEDDQSLRSAVRDTADPPQNSPHYSTLYR